MVLLIRLSAKENTPDMNKRTFILLIVLFGCVAFYFIVLRKPWSTVKADLKDFSVKDTASVSKIFLADRSGKSILLERQENNTWKLNNQQTADESKVNMLLATLYNMEVMRPVGTSEINTAIADLASRGVKVMAYKGDEVLKTIYVGSATSEQTGTYMQLEGAASPYVTHIPGFVGFLSPRFFTNEIKWRSKLVFDYEPTHIKSISVSFPLKPADAFEIDNSDPRKPLLNGMVLEGERLNFLKYYVGGFRQLYAEGYDTELGPAFADSVKKRVPYCTIKVNNITGKNTMLRLYEKGIDRRSKQTLDETGNPLSIDRDKFFGFLNDDTLLMHIQQYNFGKIVKVKSDF